MHAALLTLALTLPSAATDEADWIEPDLLRDLNQVAWLSRAIGAELWPGWHDAPFELLLVRAEDELLFSSAEVGADKHLLEAGFENLGASTLFDSRLWIRPRVYDTALRATFPAFGGTPTIVVGTPAATGLSSARWVLMVLHEHFHQWQTRDPSYYAGVDALDLAGGDESGNWMLDYAFPYDDAQVGRALAELARATRVSLDSADPADADASPADLAQLLAAVLADLEPADARYLSFQLWQEGVSRWIELRAAQLAAAYEAPTTAFERAHGADVWKREAAAAEERLHAGLEGLDLAGQRRVAFYSLGAGLAAVIDARNSGDDWRLDYAQQRFALLGLLRD